MNRILPSVDLQVSARPSVRQFADQRASKAEQVTQALLGLGHAGLQRYDQELEVRSRASEAEAVSKLEAAKKRDPKLTKLNLEAAMKADPMLRQEMEVALKSHRNSKRAMQELSASWNREADQARALEFHQMEFTRAAEQSHLLAAQGGTVEDSMKTLGYYKDNMDANEYTVAINHLADAFGNRLDLEKLKELREQDGLSIQSHSYIDNLIAQTEKALAKQQKDTDAVLRVQMAIKEHGNLAYADKDDQKVYREYWLNQGMAHFDKTNPNASPQQRAAFQNDLQVSYALENNLKVQSLVDLFGNAWNLPVSHIDGKEQVSPAFMAQYAKYKLFKQRGQLNAVMDNDSLIRFEAFELAQEAGMGSTEAYRRVNAYYNAPQSFRDRLNGNLVNQIRDKYKDYENGTVMANRHVELTQMLIFSGARSQEDASEKAEEILKTAYSDDGDYMLPKNLGLSSDRVKAVTKALIAKTPNLVGTEDASLRFDMKGFEGTAVLVRPDDSFVVRPDGTFVTVSMEDIMSNAPDSLYTSSVFDKKAKQDKEFRDNFGAYYDAMGVTLPPSIINNQPEI